MAGLKEATCQRTATTNLSPELESASDSASVFVRRSGAELQSPSVLTADSRAGALRGEWGHSRKRATFGPRICVSVRLVCACGLRPRQQAVAASAVSRGDAGTNADTEKIGSIRSKETKHAIAPVLGTPKDKDTTFLSAKFPAKRESRADLKEKTSLWWLWELSLERVHGLVLSSGQAGGCLDSASIFKTSSQRGRLARRTRAKMWAANWACDATKAVTRKCT